MSASALARLIAVQLQRGLAADGSRFLTAASIARMEGCGALQRVPPSVCYGLANWGGPVVTEVTGGDAAAIQAGLPDPDDGWSYKTFRTDGDSSTDSTEFIRAGIE